MIQLAAFSKPPEKRNADAETANAARLHEIVARIGEIDSKLKADLSTMRSWRALSR